MRLIYACYQTYLCLLSNVAMLAIKRSYACYQICFLLQRNKFSTCLDTRLYWCLTIINERAYLLKPCSLVGCATLAPRCTKPISP